MQHLARKRARRFRVPFVMDGERMTADALSSVDFGSPRWKHGATAAAGGSSQQGPRRGFVGLASSEAAGQGDPAAALQEMAGRLSKLEVRVLSEASRANEDRRALMAKLSAIERCLVREGRETGGTCAAREAEAQDEHYHGAE